MADMEIPAEIPGFVVEANTPLADRIPLEKLAGLRPMLWISVGQGFSREDVKALVLERGLALAGDAITSLSDLSLKLLSEIERLKLPSRPAIAKSALLGSWARQEILRQLMSAESLREQFPELNKLKRQTRFFKRLDETFQGARLSFVHFEEEAVFSDRLEQKYGTSPLRQELRLLCHYYEGWLRVKSLWDAPLVLRSAVDALREQGWPRTIRMPERILVLSVSAPEGLEREFWDLIGRQVPVERHSASGFLPAESLKLSWERWHTLDDATERLADSFLNAEINGTASLQEEVVLIPDHAGIRRSLKRALDHRGIRLSDPRDPTRLRWDENLKWALLPLEVVARDFERDRVVAWLRAYQMQPEFPAWFMEIQNRGVLRGLAAYEGGYLAAVHSRLKELRELLGGRKTADEISRAHLTLLRSSLPVEAEARSARAWIIGFFEALWNEFLQELGVLELRKRRAPALFWLDRLRRRLEDASLVERLKSERGVQVYRLHQAPLKRASKVWVLGVPSQWLSSEGAGDAWFNERERETLSSEFGVRSNIQVRQERMDALRAWLSVAQEAIFLDSEYEFDGRERESIAPLLREVLKPAGEAVLTRIPEEPPLLGAHPRWLASYGALRPSPPQEVRLPPLEPRDGKPPEVTASALDHYSRCAFLGLAYHRWRLKDPKAPDAELWPEARGTLLHQAAHLLIRNRDEDGNYRITPLQAVEEAWRTKPPRGLLRSERMIRYAKQKMAQVLEVFCEKERDYFRKAGARTVILDDTSFRLEYPEVALLGTPDRIDETEQGLFVMDYKSGSGQPHGTDMVDSGYRLQLPFYALAASRKLGRPALGVQFVELSRKGARSSGICFTRFNGKEAGKLTQLRSNSKSLFAQEPDEIWSRVEEQILAHARGLVSGCFDAKPKRRDKDCKDCAINDLCGFRRLADASLSDETGAEGEA